MTTPKQRERLTRLDRIDDVITEALPEIWSDISPRRGEPMHPGFPNAFRTSTGVYLEMALVPSKAQINSACAVLHRRLMRAIEAGDREEAAVALENMPEAIRAELDRLTPRGIPTPGQIRDPKHGIEWAKDLLGCCVAGGKIVQGRRRQDDRRSCPTVEPVPPFKNSCGYPRQEAEMTAVRALAEWYRPLNNGEFPRSWAHDSSKEWSRFERLVGHCFRCCGASGVNVPNLVRRVLDEIRYAELSTTRTR